MYGAYFIVSKYSDRMRTASALSDSPYALFLASYARRIRPSNPPRTVFIA
jgi:hypothetical protein